MKRQAAFPFRADHVGSLLRPAALIHARAEYEAARIGAEALRVAEDAAIREAVAMQEQIGLQVITDGEFRRKFWHLDFLTSFENVERVAPRLKAVFHTHSGSLEFEAPGIRVTGKLARRAPIFLEHFEFLKKVSKGTPKLTIPSPSVMHFRGGRAAIDEAAYPRMEDFFADLARVYAEEIHDLAAAGCRYLQIDETNLAYLCDPALREQVRRNIGADPEELARTYAKLINAAISARPADMVVMLHLCRGNFMSGWVAEGGYEPVAQVLFNEIDVDGYFLEYDDARSGGFEPLRFLPPGKVAVLGLITSKDGRLESADAIKRRIEEAARHAPLEQLALSPQCGFASTCEGNRLTLEEQSRKLGLVVRVADEIWGGERRRLNG
ncbi:MAG TPA: 5-methyltetrahydropteroyltriglutamate--homocysteine S-methyltransferase [Steroidobacteraceae bacterium]|nr:5-methyltetrahydropteroyltriglutamate--homocysteine S-methyltransferase [Steroidobacteraceae bacterium]